MTVQFDANRMELDAVARGWNAAELARQSGVSSMTISRFFRGGVIRPGTAKKLAAALEKPIKRYVLTDRDERQAVNA